MASPLLDLSSNLYETTTTTYHIHSQTGLATTRGTISSELASPGLHGYYSGILAVARAALADRQHDYGPLSADLGRAICGWPVHKEHWGRMRLSRVIGTGWKS